MGDAVRTSPTLPGSHSPPSPARSHQREGSWTRPRFPPCHRCPVAPSRPQERDTGSPSPEAALGASSEHGGLRRGRPFPSPPQVREAPPPLCRRTRGRPQTEAGGTWARGWRGRSRVRAAAGYGAVGPVSSRGEPDPGAAVAALSRQHAVCSPGAPAALPPPPR